MDYRPRPRRPMRPKPMWKGEEHGVIIARRRVHEGRNKKRFNHRDSANTRIGTS